MRVGSRFQRGFGPVKVTDFMIYTLEGTEVAVLGSELGGSKVCLASTRPGKCSCSRFLRPFSSVETPREVAFLGVFMEF